MSDYRPFRRPLVGKLISLIPLAPEHDAAIVALRNNDDARFFFDQKELMTVEQHQAFYQRYLEKKDDLYWVLVRQGQVVGANALYDLSPAGGEKGRLIMDQSLGRTSSIGNAALTAALVLEAELLLLDFAFQTIALPQVTALIRDDNQAVLAFNRRLGMVETGMTELRGRHYKCFRLTPETYRPKQFQPIIDYWARADRKQAASNSDQSASS
jgi:RimJ/RimL family protein N-acetyltransferase